MKPIMAPIFCITSDTDWASDYAITDLVHSLAAFSVKPTVFATHKTDVLDQLVNDERIDIGLHPNFLPGSSHGSTTPEVIEYVCSMYPQARTYRSHSFFSNSHISAEMWRRGFRYDSNLCLYMQPNLIPLREATGIVCFPVFWEDDVHWANAEREEMWDVDKHLPFFLSPGLKILDVHPIHFALNVPNQEYYDEVRPHIQTVNDQSLRFKGDGVRTFVMRLIETLSKQGHRFYTLGELAKLVPIKDFLTPADETQGRVTEHSEDEYTQYWNLGASQKQEFLRQSFGRRNATDPYATSRDYNARELEIESIRSRVDGKGTILDLGCGNGYTLISLAKDLKDFRMLGVDFTASLIEGALAIRDERKAELQSFPEFICADAVEYIRRCESESVRYIITERFVQNLPNDDLQKEMVRQAFRVLTSGGRFLMCEGSEDGFLSLNRLRESVGLSTIRATSKDNIATIRIKDTEFEEFATKEIGFTLVEKFGYSQYFVMTRVLHPLLIYPQSPRFDAQINDLAKLIQENMPFDAGYGSNTLWMFEK
jgi:ubiquinone/menaquinone biosynthesis C-methylase UbiE